jgi:arylsulfatase A-like enzyme
MKKPNVVLFFTDQQRWDTSGLFGNPMNLTPNYDRMATEGTHCYNAVTCQPVCLPARCALQTGRYASEMGVFRNADQLPVGSDTLGHRFRNAGYQTAYIGKWHMCHDEPVPAKRRDGYDYWLGSNVLEFTSDAYDTVMYDGNGKPIKLPGYRVDAVTDAAIRYIDQHKDNPFYLMISYIEPHFQNSRDDYPAPEGYEEHYLDHWIPPDLRALGGSSAGHLPGYYGMVKRLDEALGRLQDALRSLDLLENTIVVYTADHGCHFKTRNSEYKRSCHESSVRIPFAVSGPGFDGGGRIKDMVSLIDLPPTLLDACGIDVPENMQGHSIKPLTVGDCTDWPEEAFIEICDGESLSRAVRTQRWKYSVRAIDSLQDNGGHPRHYIEEFLYDLKADPYELNNLVGYESHREVSDIMKERLMKYLTGLGDGDAAVENAASIKSGQKRLRPEALRA